MHGEGQTPFDTKPNTFMNHKKRVVISGFETCGIIRDLAEELRRRDWDVTAIADSNKFFEETYSYKQTDFLNSFLGASIGARLAKLVSIALWRCGVFHWTENTLRRALVTRCDLYIQICAGIPDQLNALKALSRKKIPIAVMLMGSDVRDYKLFCQQYDVGSWEPPASYLEISSDVKTRRLREVEDFASAIFSVPDQMGLATRPYHHLQVPLVLPRFQACVPNRDRPKILHAPSNSTLKGTAKIEETLNRLASEGIQFEYVRIEGLKHEQLCALLTDADVVVDELILHGPGWLSMEAMASGCVVATRFLETSPDCFRPPVIPIDHRNCYDRLKMILLDKGLRNAKALAGIEYTHRNNCIRHVVDQIIEKTISPNTYPPDYVPIECEVTETKPKVLNPTVAKC